MQLVVLSILSMPNEAADFECVGVDNAELFDWIKDNLQVDDHS